MFWTSNSKISKIRGGSWISGLLAGFGPILTGYAGKTFGTCEKEKRWCWIMHAWMKPQTTFEWKQWGNYRWRMTNALWGTKLVRARRKYREEPSVSTNFAKDIHLFRPAGTIILKIEKNDTAATAVYAYVCTNTSVYIKTRSKFISIFKNVLTFPNRALV